DEMMPVELKRFLDTASGAARCRSRAFASLSWPHALTSNARVARLKGQNPFAWSSSQKYSPPIAESDGILVRHNKVGLFSQLKRTVSLGTQEERASFTP